MSKRPRNKQAAKSAKALLSSLDEVEQVTILITVSAKSSEEDDTVLLVSSPKSDGQWRPVPVSSIVDIFSAQDGVLPDGSRIVHLVIKGPKSLEGKLFATFASIKGSEPIGIDTISNFWPAPLRPMGDCPAGQRWVWDQAAQRWICAAV